MTQNIFALTSAFAFLALSPMGQAQDITPKEARAIAKEAAIYGFPVIDNYRISYDYYYKPGNPDYKGPVNTLTNIPRVYTKWLALDSQSPIWQGLAMEITASCFKLRANVPEGRKRFPISQKWPTAAPCSVCWRCTIRNKTSEPQRH